MHTYTEEKERKVVLINIECTEVVGWKHAIRGMRNPLNSWDRSDSDSHPVLEGDIGPNDLALMKRLANAGSDDRKYLRMIIVCTDIIAPMYWWKEFDTYKVGTVRNSCSTMHKIHAKEFTLDDFSYERLSGEGVELLQKVIDTLNEDRKWYNTESIDNKKDYWYEMIQLLPSSYNQRATVMLNYEVLKNMYHARKNHKLDEWHTFCDWVKTLPYSELITGEE